MTKLTVETDNNWTKKKIKDAIDTETALLRKAVWRCEARINNFEKRYGKLNRDRLYKNVDDMELIEWEGEIETLEKLREKLAAIEGIVFEYK